MPRKRRRLNPGDVGWRPYLRQAMSAVSPHHATGRADIPAQDAFSGRAARVGRRGIGPHGCRSPAQACCTCGWSYLINHARLTSRNLRLAEGALEIRRVREILAEIPAWMVTSQARFSFLALSRSPRWRGCHKFCIACSGTALHRCRQPDRGTVSRRVLLHGTLPDVLQGGFLERPGLWFSRARVRRIRPDRCRDERRQVVRNK